MLIPVKITVFFEVAKMYSIIVTIMLPIFFSLTSSQTQRYASMHFLSLQALLAAAYNSNVLFHSIHKIVHLLLRE